jgi:type IV secretory pathway VirB10-like protein
MAEPEQNPEPSVRDRTRQPSGVLPKNLKPYLYGGAVILLLLATFISSHTKPAGGTQPTKDTPPQPLLQDQTANNVAEMRNELAQEKQKEAQDAALAQSLASQNPAQQGAIQGYGPDGKPIRGAVPAQGEPAPQQNAAPDPAQQAAIQLEADERKRIDNARFASNLVFTKSQDSSREPQPAGQSQQANSGGQGSALTTTTMPTPATPPSRDQIPATAYKRPQEVNLNSAVGQPYVIYEGLTLDTILMNRLDGDAVGPVKVLVSNPVYSHDHQHVLIPEGTVVLGEARKIGASGTGQQRRIAVVFHRLIMPDGFTVDLDQFTGLNQIGETALKDKVNNHYLQIFGTSIALGVIAGTAEIQQGGGAISTSGPQAFTTGAAGSVSSSATTVLDQFLQIPPTITIREGHRVKVYFTQDILVPAYDNHRIAQSF